MANESTEHPPPVGADYLDDLPPCDCGCEEQILSGKCHPGGGVHALYVSALRAVRLTCSECHELIVWIAVADTWQPRGH